MDFSSDVCVALSHRVTKNYELEGVGAARAFLRVTNESDGICVCCIVAERQTASQLSSVREENTGSR